MDMSNAEDKITADDPIVFRDDWYWECIRLRTWIYDGAKKGGNRRVNPKPRKGDYPPLE